jgi:hypothetical protein
VVRSKGISFVGDIKRIGMDVDENDLASLRKPQKFTNAVTP